MWEVHRSALRPGEDDVVRAAAHAVVAYPVPDGDDPPRELLLGPDRAGNLLEPVVLLLDDGRQLLIHAMPMRPKYRRLTIDSQPGVKP